MKRTNVYYKRRLWGYVHNIELIISRLYYGFQNSIDPMTIFKVDYYLVTMMFSIKYK